MKEPLIAPPEIYASPFEERLAHVIKNTARAYIRALQMRLNEHSVSYGHWSILRVLWSRPGITQRELSEAAGISEPTTFSALKALATLGYVERKHLPGNNKKVHIYLTAVGRELEGKLVPLAEEVNAISVRNVSAEDLATTQRVLDEITRALAQDEREGDGPPRRLPSTQEVGRRVIESSARTQAAAAAAVSETETE